MVTGFQGMGLHECDVLGITKAGYLVEFEIKRSRSDFRADFKKKHKHECLKEGKGVKRGRGRNKGRIWFKTTNRFYYICEDGLIKKSEVPKYAGLMYITKGGTVKTIKTAPLLHKQKATADLYESIANNLTAKMIFGCSYMNWSKKQHNKLLKS
jgi:hypothetical protein